MGVAREERRMVAELFEDVGPDAPTLCGDWTARDLAAHLVLRERRPDAAGGILLSPLAGYTKKVQDKLTANPWPRLVNWVRSGPPAWSPYAIGALDELLNSAEFFVHHEDLRRAQPDWRPRPADPVRDAAMWKALRVVGRIVYRRSPIGVALRRPDGAELWVRRGPRTVSVVGEPGELLLYAFGREQAVVDFEGDQADIAVVKGLDRSL